MTLTAIQLETGKNAVTGLASAMVSAYSQRQAALAQAERDDLKVADDRYVEADWLGYWAGYVVIVDRASQLLADEEPAAFDEMLGLFGRVTAHWAEPITEGEWWDRPGRPFHFVFQESAEQGEVLLTRLKLVGASVGEVWRED